MMNDLVTVIKEHDNFALVTHINPDGDALGSVFALNMALLTLGKKSNVILMADMPKKYVFEEFKAEYIPVQDTGKDYGCVIAVDCADINRLGDAKALFKEAPITVNIDHHSSNNGFAQINAVVLEPSCGEIIFDLICALDVPVDRDIASALYIAISSDTGNFTYENTSPRTFERCAVLAGSGVPVAKIANYLYNAKTYEATMLIGKVISNLRLFHDGKVAVTQVTMNELRETGASAEDCETVINYARDIDTVEFAVFIRQFKEKTYKVSFRSKENIDVMEIAKRFGGGGHVRASGCTMSGDLYDIRDTILSIAKEFFG